MKQVFVIGAGRSSGTLIDYLLAHADKYDWSIIVGDASISLGQEKIKDNPRAKAIAFNVFDTGLLEEQVKQVDLVISLLPASLHHYVAKACVQCRVHMLTASYVSEEIKELDIAAQQNGVMLMMECGLDPGIDHMSACAEIQKIKDSGGEIISYKSYTGGLIAPESDDNPWNYKVTWNPRNIVLAGKGMVKFIRNDKYKYIPYHSVFKRLEQVSVKGYGDFEAYPNRDSLKYRSLYNLKKVPTLLRGTLRRPGFCRAWDVLVQLGMTDEGVVIEGSENLTYRDFLNSFLAYNQEKPVEEKLANYFGIPINDDIIDKLKWLGLFDKRAIKLKNATPLAILQDLLERKWKLAPTDRDMIVMQHIFEYKVENEIRESKCSMVVKGENADNTSMARTVGLPVGIVAKLILTERFNQSGVQIPVMKELYEPVLNELKTDYGIDFFY